jgi:hypothetical protein
LLRFQKHEYGLEGCVNIHNKVSLKLKCGCTIEFYIAIQAESVVQFALNFCGYIVLVSRICAFIAGTAKNESAKIATKIFFIVLLL